MIDLAQGARIYTAPNKMSQIFKFLNLPVHETRVIGFDSLQIILIKLKF